MTRIPAFHERIAGEKTMNLAKAEPGIEPRETRAIAGNTPASAVHTAASPGNGIETSERNRFAAYAAHAVFAGFHATQREINFAQGAKFELDVGDGHARGIVACGYACIVLRLLLHEDFFTPLFNTVVKLVTFRQEDFAEVLNFVLFPSIFLHAIYPPFRQRTVCVAPKELEIGRDV